MRKQLASYCLELLRFIDVLRLRRNWKGTKHSITEFYTACTHNKDYIVYRIILDLTFKNDCKTTSRISERVEKHGERKRKLKEIRNLRKRHVIAELTNKVRVESKQMEYQNKVNESHSSENLWMLHILISAQYICILEISCTFSL